MLDFDPGDKPESYGHYFIVGLSGITLDDYDKAILSKLRPIGLLLLRRNFDFTRDYAGWLELAQRLVDDAKRYTGRDKLIVSIDHEGGKVHRLPPPITRFPSAMHYAGCCGPVAKAMAIELKSVGVNLSWAPVTDIHSNPANPIIGDRAFGTKPLEVADRCVEFLRAMESEGILGCAKHFPGHGDTSTDSHLELPVLNLSERDLRERELVPFAALVHAGVSFVMTAHILFPQIDPHWPATLSNKVLKDLLRRDLGFNKVIISDDLDMKAVSRGFEDEENVGRAINAGCDMFIVARQPDPATDRPLLLTNYLFRCLQRRVVSEDRLHESYLRIKEVMERIGSNSVKALDEGVFEEHAKLARDCTPPAPR